MRLLDETERHGVYDHREVGSLSMEVDEEGVHAKGSTDGLEQHDATAQDDTDTRIDGPKEPAEKHTR